MWRQYGLVVKKKGIDIEETFNDKIVMMRVYMCARRLVYFSRIFILKKKNQTNNRL